MKKKYNNLINQIFIVISLFAISATINNSSTVLKIYYPLKYVQEVNKYSAEYSLDRNLVFAVIKAESSFKPNARSHKNAVGLMQVTERTAMWAAEVLKIKDFSVAMLYQPETNIKIGCWYLSRLMKQFNNNIDLVIAAYNGGSGNVNEWLRDPQLSDSGDILNKIPFKETSEFVEKVNIYHNAYKSLYK